MARYPEPRRGAPPGRILVFCLSGIGDAARFLPALGLLRRSFPEAHITVVTMFRGAFELFEGSPDLDDLRCIDFFHASLWDRIAALLRLRREHFDLCIMSFPANRLGYNLAQRAVGSRWRAAHRYGRQSLRNLWFLNNITLREDRRLHNVEENLRLVGEVARKFGNGRQDAPIPPDHIRCGSSPCNLERGLAEDLPAAPDPASPRIAIHPYSSAFKNMHRKCWPAHHFAELIDRLAARYPSARFLLISGPDDRETTIRIVELAHAPLQLVEGKSLRHVMNLLRKCDLFVGNDAGITHVAAAAGTPVVAIFGPTDWHRLHPWCEQYTVVRRDLPCMPCFYYSSRPLRCPAGIHFACLRELKVDQVEAAACTLLARCEHPPRCG